MGDVVVADGAETVVGDWSLAPDGIRQRAEHVERSARRGDRVAVIQLHARGVLTDGGWAVAIIRGDGRKRRLLYAEDSSGRLIADWTEDVLADETV